MIIRKASEADRSQIWEIFQAVIQTGDSFVFDPATPESCLDKYWLAPEMTTFVADEGGHITGTYIIKPNQVGLGSHIANCSYMVHPQARGRGIGRMMAEHSLEFARRHRFRGMQFNIVVSTNHAALELWKKLGFRIIGVTPGGFRHKLLGYVDSCIMFREL